MEPGGDLKRRLGGCVLILVLLFASSVKGRHVSGDKLHHYAKQLAKEASMKSITSTSTTSTPPLDHWGLPTVKSVNTGYLIHADDVVYQPAYDNSVNPFLSHIEQGWRLAPLRKNKLGKGKDKFVKEGAPNDFKPPPLPLDPTKPHFMDYDDDADANEDYHSFGDEEKDLHDLFDVLFSPDYRA